MTDAFKQQIQAEARQAVEELLEQAKLKKGDVFVAVSYTHPEPTRP